MGKEKVFRFKEFAVSNERSPMKVGTDGVLLGAWCRVDGAQRVLDVGTGTGVIALMLAQRQPGAVITGIDIDHEASLEAAANFAASPWSTRLAAIEGNFLSSEALLGPFDLIVSNPPFFTRQVHSPNERRDAARNAAALPFENLFARVAKLLAPEGRFALITPADAREDIHLHAAMASLHVTRFTMVEPVAGRPAKRLLWEFSPLPAPTLRDTLVLHDNEGNATPRYAALVAPFYLHF